MNYHIEGVLREDTVNCRGVEDVALNECCIGSPDECGQIVLLYGWVVVVVQIVENHDFVSTSHKCLAEMTADETCSACKEDIHG